MPVYCYSCSCGHTTDEYRHVDQRNDAPEHCGRAMERVITPHRVMADIQPYRSMVDGTMITSRRHHREHLKQHRMIEVGNDTAPLFKPKRVKLDREKRKRQIAEVMNNR